MIVPFQLVVVVQLSRTWKSIALLSGRCDEARSGCFCCIVQVISGCLEVTDSPGNDELVRVELWKTNVRHNCS